MIETLAPRLLMRRPMEAVVMPLPTDETTPPVTKMYFGIRPLPPRPFAPVRRGDACIARSAAGRQYELGNRLWPFGPRTTQASPLQAPLRTMAARLAHPKHHQPHRLPQVARFHGQLLFRLGHRHAEVAAERIQTPQLAVPGRGGVLHGDDHLRRKLAGDFGGASRIEVRI